jgi:hypothetical protein
LRVLVERKLTIATAKWNSNNGFVEGSRLQDIAREKMHV